MPDNASTQHNPATTTTLCPMLTSMLRGAIQSLTPEQLLSLLTEEQKSALSPSEKPQTKQEAIDALEEEYADLLVVGKLDDLYRKYSQENIAEHLKNEHDWIVAEDWNDLTARYSEEDVADALRDASWKCFEDDSDVEEYAKEYLEMIDGNQYEEVKDCLQDTYDALVFEDDDEARDYVKDLGEDIILDLEDDLEASLAKMMKILTNEGYTVSKDMVVLQPSVIDQVVALLQGTTPTSEG